MELIVATTTSIHNETGTNSLITCLAPYFNSSSSSGIPESFDVGKIDTSGTDTSAYNDKLIANHKNKMK